MEKEFTVKPIGVKYICDYCKVGEMISTGNNNWSSNPPKLEHKCNHCGTKILLNEKYPLIRYKTINKEFF